MGVQINGSEGNVIATKGTFSGDVGIGGTLTYEDVTNIDSVGLVTARSGIEIGARPGVAASISVDGNAIFSGITTVGGNVKVGSGVTLSPDGDIFVTGISTFNSRVLLGTTTEGVSNADDLTIATSGHTGITIRSGTSNQGNIFFSDGTSGADEYRGYLQYEHTANALIAGTDGSERLRIASDGAVTFNTSSGDNAFLVKGDSYTAVRVQAARDDASDKAMFQMLGSRGTNASPTIVQSGDRLGTISARGYDGNSYAQSSSINFICNTSPGDGDMPGAIEFQTSPDGSEVPATGIKLDHNGNITTPKQFHIEVRRTDDQTGYNAGSDFGIPMVFTDVVTTRGTTSSALNTSTGKITVPLDGVYFLEASVVVSGSVVQQLWFTEGNSRMQYSDHTENAMTTRVQASGMHYLSANTQVGVKPYGSGSSSITILDSIYHTWFRVTLMG